jgi:hypothetical protein
MVYDEIDELEGNLKKNDADIFVILKTKDVAKIVDSFS